MKKEKILLVDDDHVIIDFISYNLEKENYNVKTAMNGQDAISIAKEFVPDLILLDVMMPEMDGISATKVIRSEIDTEFQPIIIALTANAMAGDREIYLQAGMDDYLSKPIEMRTLKKVISKYGQLIFTAKEV